MSRIMKGRDCRSVRFVVPDVHLVDRGFHDVTVVDMGDDREPTIVLQDMTRLRELWPVKVFDQMKSRQQDLELMRKSAKKNYQQVRPMPCRFCGKVIRVDMYRHVARLHLDLVHADTGPDLSREGPFNAYDVVPDAGQSPVVMDSMAGCQYRMTSYEERVTDSDMNPSYGIHMHDPHVIEYMGAPESARLMGRTPEYWLQHMVVSARSRLRFVCIMTPVSS